MKKQGSIIAAVITTAALIMLPVTSAAATTSAVGGGLWDRGSGGLRVYSYYHHGSKYHSATACDGALFKTCVKAAAAKGVWAKAAKAGSWSGNTAFWATY